MKKKVSLNLFLLGFLALLVQPALASTIEKIEQCGDRDAKCVGKVLLEKLNEMEVG